jgi:serine protease Do
MSKKTIITSIALITVGIIFGAVLVSNIGGGVAEGLAGEGVTVKLGGPTPVASPNQALKGMSDNFVAVAKGVTPSVVAIEATTPGDANNNRRMPRDFFHFFGPDQEPIPSRGYGSGVIITADGYIATNNHVVDGASKGSIEVTLHDKRTLRARLVGTDPSTDLAVIKVESKNLPAAALGNSDEAQVGEWVLAVGNPLQLTSTVTAGIISAIGRNIRIIEDNYGIENFIQTDAAINPGNSGGALVNLKGEVIGINTAIATTNQRYQGYGFAVPVNLLKVVAQDLIEHGEVKRGYIGVSITAVDPTTGKAMGLSEGRGVFVQRVIPDGAGDRAGLLTEDIILSVDGKDVNEANELQAIVATKRPGDVVTLKVWRDQKEREIKVTLRPREEERTTTRAGDTREEDEPLEKPAGAEAKFESLGLTVRSLTAQEKRDLDLESGVLVASVTQYGEAFNRYFRQNQVILEADRKPVADAGALKKVIESHKPGDAILFKVRADRQNTVYLSLEIPPAQ